MSKSGAGSCLPPFTWVSKDFMDSRARHLTAGAFTVYLHLAYHCDNPKSSVCNPSIARIEERSGFDRKSIERALKELEAKGDIVVTRANGRRNEYTLIRRSADETDPIFSRGSADETDPIFSRGGTPESPVVPTPESPPEQEVKNQNKNQTLNVVDPGCLPGHKNGLPDMLAQDAVRVTKDPGSLKRFRQLAGICDNQGTIGIWDLVLHQLSQRMERGGVKTPGAYFQSALARELEKVGVHVPMGTADERAQDQAAIEASRHERGPKHTPAASRK